MEILLLLERSKEWVKLMEKSLKFRLNLPIAFWLEIPDSLVPILEEVSQLKLKFPSNWNHMTSKKV